MANNHLNLNNTGNFYNFNLVSKDYQQSMEPVVPSNAVALHKKIGNLRESKEWLDLSKRPRLLYYVQSFYDIYTSFYTSDLVDLIEMGADVTVFTRFPVPDKVLDALAKSDVGRILYQFPSNPHRLQELIPNVQKAHEATVVDFDCAVKIPNISPITVLKALDPYGPFIDHLEVDVCPLHDSEVTSFQKSLYCLVNTPTGTLWYPYPENVFSFCKQLQRTLSSRGILMDVTYHTEDERVYLEKRIKEDHKS